MHCAIRMLLIRAAAICVAVVAVLAGSHSSEAITVQKVATDIAAERGIDCIAHDHHCPGPRRHCQHAVRHVNLQLRKENQRHQPPMQLNSANPLHIVQGLQPFAMLMREAIVGVPCVWIRRGPAFKAAFAVTMRMRN